MGETVDRQEPRVDGEVGSATTVGGITTSAHVETVPEPGISKRSEIPILSGTFFGHTRVLEGGTDAKSSLHSYDRRRSCSDFGVDLVQR